MKSILYLTDLYYPAKGRNYYEEDLYITSRLKESFNVLIGHPHQALEFAGKTDLIVFRNTGPVLGYKFYFEKFRQTVLGQKIPIYNSFDGKADMLGKQYLLDLTKEQYPVIPTVENVEEIDKLGNVLKYIVKPKYGADSVGMQVVEHEAWAHMNIAGCLIQPMIDFVYEVSFYFMDNVFQYALCAPEKEKRWQLEIFKPSKDDLLFADKFIQWNNMACGIQRVDACRLKDGSLLLVELEDLNPYLSIDRLPAIRKEKFVQDFAESLSKMN